MSAGNHDTPPTQEAKKVKVMRNPVLTLCIMETVLLQCFFPECPWDRVEECVGWCRERMLDPAPLRRIGREWVNCAERMKHLLEALYVRSAPEKFCCGLEGKGEPHALAILLGEIIGNSQEWQAEVRCQDPGVVLIDRLEFPAAIWWVRSCKRGAEWVVRRSIQAELPDWCRVVNPGVRGEYFQLWKDLNMLYERLSLPWELLQRPELSQRKSISTVINDLYDEINTYWDIRKGNIQNYDAVHVNERVKIYAEEGIEPHRGPRTPWMKLDYDSWDTRVEETADDFLKQPKDKPPRKLYRKHCTWKEQAVLNVECSVDGIPWKLDGGD